MQTADDLLNNLTIERGGIFNFSVHVDGWQYDFRFNEKVPGDCLYVNFNGAVDRQKHSIPAFARWNWHAFYGAPILAVFDPALYLSSALRVGWFVGTKERDVTGEIASLIEAFARRIGIEPGRVICYGGSGGGFAAMAVAARMSKGRFIAVNPQTEIVRYHRGHIKDFTEFFDASKTPQENAEAFPLRWSAIHAVGAARERGANLKGLIMQNTVDVFHHDNHYLPFCNAMGLPPEGGNSPDGSLFSGLYVDEKGHGPEPADVARRIMDEYIPKLLDGVK